MFMFLYLSQECYSWVFHVRSEFGLFQVVNLSSSTSLLLQWVAWPVVVLLKIYDCEVCTEVVLLSPHAQTWF